MFDMTAVYPGDDEMVYSVADESTLKSVTMVKDDRRPIGPAQELRKLRASPDLAILIPKTPGNNLHVVLKSAKGSRDAESMKRKAWRDG